MSCQNVVYHAPALGQQQHVSFLANIIQNLFFLNIKTPDKNNNSVAPTVLFWFAVPFARNDEWNWLPKKAADRTRSSVISVQTFCYIYTNYRILPSAKI
jgi:hypothetical protein